MLKLIRVIERKCKNGEKGPFFLSIRRGSQRVKCFLGAARAKKSHFCERHFKHNSIFLTSDLYFFFLQIGSPKIWKIQNFAYGGTLTVAAKNLAKIKNYIF